MKTEKNDERFVATIKTKLSIIDMPSIQKSLEKFYMEEALKMTGGNECKAANLLNINHHTFRYREKKLQIK